MNKAVEFLIINLFAVLNIKYIIIYRKYIKKTIPEQERYIFSVNHQIDPTYTNGNLITYWGYYIALRMKYHQAAIIAFEV